MTARELLQEALDAWTGDGPAIELDRIRAFLAQPEPEPVESMTTPTTLDEWADNWGAMSEQHRYVAREAWEAALSQRTEQTTRILRCERCGSERKIITYCARVKA